MNKDCPLLIIGAGGHASVLAEIIKIRQLLVLGVVALNEQPIKGYEQYPCLGNDDSIKNYDPATVRLVNAIGTISVEANAKRGSLFKKYKTLGYQFATLIHPAAVVSSTAHIQEGAQVMAGAIIQSNTTIGHNTIINTRASIDHDCQIGNSVHIAPSATLSGGVTVGDYTFIGAGATIIQGRMIAENEMIRAGTLVIKHRIGLAQKDSL